LSIQRAKPTRAARNGKATTWPEAVDRFMTHLEHAGKSPHTTHHYRDDLRMFATWWAEGSLGDLFPGKITDYDLREFQRHLREDRLDAAGRTRKPATINAKMAAVKSFLHWAGRAKLIASVPESPRRARLGARRVKWLDRAQQRQLLREAARDRSPRNLAVVEILIETGLRVAEFVALRWDLDVRLTERKGWVTVQAGKGRKPRGPLPLSTIARNAFRRLRDLDPDAQPGDPATTSKRKDGDGRNKALTARGVQELLCTYAGKLKWDTLHPHQLRHTCAVNMRARGVDWPTIAAYLGHSSVKTTMDNYATPSERDLEAAVAGSGEDD
jgi:integrase/recombinase XerC